VHATQLYKPLWRSTHKLYTGYSGRCDLIICCLTTDLLCYVAVRTDATYGVNGNTPRSTATRKSAMCNVQPIRTATHTDSIIQVLSRSRQFVNQRNKADGSSPLIDSYIHTYETACLLTRHPNSGRDLCFFVPILYHQTQTNCYDPSTFTFFVELPL
jgi:hypothetical protein